MAPLIFENDILVVNRSFDRVYGRVSAVVFEEELVCKRIFCYPGSHPTDPKNSKQQKHPSFLIDERADFRYIYLYKRISPLD